VLGREFMIRVLTRVTDVPEDDLLDTLDEAVDARVLSGADAPGRLRFAHVLIRDTLYEGLTTTRRIRLHRQAVAALEEVYGAESGPFLAELAHHAIEATDFERGLRYARRGGDRAFELLAYEESARLYRTALEALQLAQPADERTRCELLLSLGEAEARAGNMPAAKEAFLEAAAIARRLDLPHELGRAAAGYGGRIVFARAADDERLVPLLEEALAALPSQEVELRIRLLARLAGTLRDDAVRDRRDELSREALELARATGDRRSVASALHGRSAAIIAPDNVAECLALSTELLDVATQIGDRELIVQAHSDRCMAQLILGDVEGAQVDVTAAGHVADELDQPAQHWQVRGEEAMLALATGRLHAAEELIAETFTFGERSQPELAIPVHAVQRYTLCDLRGSVSEAAAAVEEVAARYRARPVFRCVRAHLHERLGRRDDAKRELDELAADRFAALPFDQEWLFAVSLLAETVFLVEDDASPSVLYELLLPWAPLNAVDQAEGVRGSVSRYLALLAAAMRCWDEARDHFEHALEMNDRMGLRPWLANTQHDYARLLLEIGDDGDRKRARELAAAAHATYRELGMETYAARAAALSERVAAH
jgi:eukaryotic-like serine/threonine-protein kinase